MWIKICANTNLADAQLAVTLGADAVGFVFAPSKRQVNGPQVGEITRQLPAHVEKVGVFNTPDPDEIAGLVASSGLTAVQIHRPFEVGLTRELAERFAAGLGRDVKLIQTISYDIDAADRASADRRFAAALAESFAEPAVWAVLIDAARSGTSGGLGVSFDWAHAAGILGPAYASHEARGVPRPRVILAGGLQADNVAAAIAALHPWGVDVASGVEAAPGRKHPERLRRFFAAAR